MSYVLIAIRITLPLTAGEGLNTAIEGGLYSASINKD